MINNKEIRMASFIALFMIFMSACAQVVASGEIDIKEILRVANESGKFESYYPVDSEEYKSEEWMKAHVARACGNVAVVANNEMTASCNNGAAEFKFPPDYGSVVISGGNEVTAIFTDQNGDELPGDCTKVETDVPGTTKVECAQQLMARFINVYLSENAN